MAILLYFRKYFTYLIPELKSYRIDSTYANGNLLFSKGNFVGDIYTESGNKIYFDGDYYGDHYVSCIALDEHGLTILNSGGIRIYKEAGDDGASIQYDKNGNVLVNGEPATPVFWADEDGNLQITGTITAMTGSSITGATITKSSYSENYVSITDKGLTISNCGGIQIYNGDGTESEKNLVFWGDEEGNLYLKGEITASSGKIGGFTITGNSLENCKSGYGDGNSGIYLGTDGIGLGKITGYESPESDEDKQYTTSGFCVDSEGNLWSKNGTFEDATIQGTGQFNSITSNVISAENEISSTTMIADKISVQGKCDIKYENGGIAVDDDKIKYASIRVDGSVTYFKVVVEIWKDGNENEECYLTSGQTFKVKYISQNGKSSGYTWVTVSAGDCSGESESFDTSATLGNLYRAPDASFVLDDDLKTVKTEETKKQGTLITMVSFYSKVTGTLTISSSLCPKENALSTSGYNLGQDGLLWHTVYAVTGEIRQSDENVKNGIEKLPEEYSTLFDNLIPVRYKLNSGTSGRYHTGFIAQQVEQAIKESGLSSKEFAAYVYDQENSFCGLRYEEFISLLVKEVQTLKEKVKDLEDRIIDT